MTSTTQTRNADPSFAHPDLTWEEIGFAEFPVVTTSLRRPPFDTLEFTDQIGVDKLGEPIYRTWQMVGSAEYGLPRLSDLDVFIAIVKILERHNFERRLVPCDASDICEIAGLARGGETHRRIRNAFVRFQTTSYIAKNHFIDPTTHERVLSEGWDIITDHRIIHDPSHAPDRDGLPASYFAVGHAFLRRLRQGQLKPLDLGLWRELPLGLAKPIFHYLDKNLYHKGRHEVGLRKFSQRIGLTGHYDLAQLKRLCRKPLDVLVRKRFLDEFQYEASKSPTDPIKLVVIPGPRARSERRTAPKAQPDHFRSRRAAERHLARNSGLQVAHRGFDVPKSQPFQSHEARARQEYERWLNDRLDQRWHALGPEVREAAIKTADGRLQDRAGAAGVLQMSPSARRNTAERLARASLGSDLPTFEQWRASQASPV